MEIHHFLADALIILGASVLVLLLSHRLRLPAVVGLLLTGVLIGPSGLRLFPDPEAVELFAEIGVVFLLFAIGLEFSLERLAEIRRAFFLGGSVQAGLTILLVVAVALLFEVPPLAALFFGFVAALSSTAVVLKLYDDRREMESPHGRVVLGILLFQDFLIVPMIVLTPVLAGAVAASPAEIALRFGGGVVVVGIVFVVARYLMPKLLHRLVRTRIREVFVLGALLVCLGMAYFTEQLGFSLALGAFIAGLIVSESEYSHQVVADMAPFRDVFTSVFFVSIGMLVDLGAAWERWPRVLGIFALVLVVKALTGGLAAAALRLPPRVVAIVGLGLAQIGEFSFVLLTVGRGQGLLDAETYQVGVAVAVLSMLATPALVAVAPRLGQRLPAGFGFGLRTAPETETAARKPLRHHVIVVGYGHAGRTLAHVLSEAHIPYVVLELNGDTVRRARREGEPVLYGDSTRREILEHAGIETAAMVVFAISDPAALERSIAFARQLNPEVRILVRTRAVAQIEALQRQGADEVVAEEFESAIEIFTRVLARYHVPRNVIRAQTRLLRGEGYRMLRAPSLSAGATEAVLRALEAGTTDLHRLEADSPAVGGGLKELDLRRRTGATVIAVVRGEESFTNPGPELTLEPGDVLVLVGSHAELEAAMALLEGEGEGYPGASPSPSSSAPPSTSST
jgi:monovalent cation:H+ antiporter-2, CPA2 family